jgi:hypothetical protein
MVLYKVTICAMLRWFLEISWGELKLRVIPKGYVFPHWASSKPSPCARLVSQIRQIKVVADLIEYSRFCSAMYEKHFWKGILDVTVNLNMLFSDTLALQRARHDCVNFERSRGGGAIGYWWFEPVSFVVRNESRLHNLEVIWIMTMKQLGSMSDWYSASWA